MQPSPLSKPGYHILQLIQSLKSLNTQSGGLESSAQTIIVITISYLSIFPISLLSLASFSFLPFPSFPCFLFLSLVLLSFFSCLQMILYYNQSGIDCMSLMTTVPAKSKYQASMKCLSWTMIVLHFILQSQRFSIHEVLQNRTSFKGNKIMSGNQKHQSISICYYLLSQ